MSHPADVAVVAALCDRLAEFQDARDQNLAIRFANEVWSRVK